MTKNPPLGPEDILNLALADKLVGSPEFVSWVLTRTKFTQCADKARLLSEEQEGLRNARFWWRHWWCRVPELADDSETDIFLAFEVQDTKQRFSLHIENKLANSTFTPNQELSYPIRARHMLTNTKAAILNCMDFDTVLIAPESFRKKYREKSDKFGCFISHEDIAKFIPAFSL